MSSLYLAPSPTPTLTEQAVLEVDQLSEQETRDLLVSVLFVLKYLDRGLCGVIAMVSWASRCARAELEMTVKNIGHIVYSCPNMRPQLYLGVDS